MAKTLMAGSSTNTTTSTANTTQWPTIAGDKIFASSEAIGQIPVRAAGTLSDFALRIGTNSVSASTVFTVRKNGADTTCVITAGSGATGVFEDTTHSFTVTAGDLLVVRSVPGAGSTGTFTLYHVKMEFDTDASTTKTVTRLGATCGSLNTGHTAASTSYRYAIGSAIPTGTTTNATETVAQTIEKYSATYRNLGVRVTANSRTTVTTGRFRKNASDGNQSVSIGNSATGWFEDTTNSDTVVSGDLTNFQLTTGTGTSAFSLFGFVVDYETATNPGTARLGCSYTTAQSDTQGVTDYIPVLGKFNTFMITESLSQIKLNSAYTFKMLVVTPTQNNTDAASTVCLRVNGVDSALIVSIPANSTAQVTDSTHTVTIAAGDLVNFRVTIGTGVGGDTLTLQAVQVWTEIAGVSTGTITATPTSKAVVNKFITHYP
jgi:hypothetical protein